MWKLLEIQFRIREMDVSDEKQMEGQLKKRNQYVRRQIMINILKKQNGMSIVGQGGKIILFTNVYKDLKYESRR